MTIGTFMVTVDMNSLEALVIEKTILDLLNIGAGAASAGRHYPTAPTPGGRGDDEVFHGTPHTAGLPSSLS